MNKVVLRLFAILLFIVGVGWLVLKFVDFPGDFKAVKNHYDNHIEIVSNIIIENANQISEYNGYEITEFVHNKDSYEQIIVTIKDIFTTGKAKNFTWQNEKKLKSSMNKTFKTDNELKDYILSVTTYACSLDPNAEEVQKMINNTKDKLNNLVEEYETLKDEINSFLIEIKN